MLKGRQEHRMKEKSVILETWIDRISTRATPLRSRTFSLSSSLYITRFFPNKRVTLSARYLQFFCSFSFSSFSSSFSWTFQSPVPRETRWTQYQAQNTEYKMQRVQFIEEWSNWLRVSKRPLISDVPSEANESQHGQLIFSFSTPCTIHQTVWIECWNSMNIPFTQRFKKRERETCHRCTFLYVCVPRLH